VAPVLRRYVYGTLRDRASAGQRHWSVVLEDPMRRLGAKARTWDDSSEFVAGPFPPGEANLTVTSTAGERFHAKVPVDSGSRDAIRFDIDVAQFQIEHTAAAQAADGAPAPLKGSVFLADGHTPALGAQVLYWYPHKPAPALFAMADASGNLQRRGPWSIEKHAAVDNSTGPDSATAIAFLPGTTGAVVRTVSSMDDLAHLVLPIPIAARGRVTVGGASPLERPGGIRVIAAYQGKGNLNPYLSVTVSAAADGSFELAGLTRGEYLVQAALDDIWLSAPVTLRVGDAPPHPIALDIPAPGAPVRVHVRDSSGRAVAGASVTLDRTGPLADVWPKDWVSDAEGWIEIPTLEAGAHTVRAAAASGPVSFSVPPLPGAPVAVEVEIKRQ
jgi:hypothetical protein